MGRGIGCSWDLRIRKQSQKCLLGILDGAFASSLVRKIQQSCKEHVCGPSPAVFEMGTVISKLVLLT